MKKVKMLFAFLFGLIVFSPAQIITVLSKDDVVKCPEDGFVLMDKYTFGKYHYTSEKYDTLKKEVLALDSVIKKHEATQEQLAKDYEANVQSKDIEINDLKAGFKSMESELNTSIEKNNQLQLDYKKLDEHRRRSNRWRNIFMGTSAVSIGILVLLIAH
ncbi:MAG: hypothetical protein ACXVNO_00215 [Bacteroidia bacterium]